MLSLTWSSQKQALHWAQQHYPVNTAVLTPLHQGTPGKDERKRDGVTGSLWFNTHLVTVWSYQRCGAGSSLSGTTLGQLKVFSHLFFPPRRKAGHNLLHLSTVLSLGANVTVFCPCSLNLLHNLFSFLSLFPLSRSLTLSEILGFLCLFISHQCHSTTTPLCLPLPLSLFSSHISSYYKRTKKK